MYLEKINGPEDVKKIKIDELPVLAQEIRDALLVRASKHGGHFGPNFGMVEATIALHYVFESPRINLFMMYRTRVILIRCLRGVRKRICLNSTMMMCQAIQIQTRASMIFLQSDIHQRRSVWLQVLQRQGT